MGLQSTANIPAFPHSLGRSSQKRQPLMIVYRHLSILNDSVHEAFVGRPTYYDPDAWFGSGASKNI